MRVLLWAGEALVTVAVTRTARVRRLASSQFSEVRRRDFGKETNFFVQSVQQYAGVPLVGDSLEAVFF